MIVLFNGREAPSLVHILSSDSVWTVQYLNDDGTPIDISAPAVCTLELFAGDVRTDTPPLTLPVTITGSSVSGYGTVSVQDTVTGTTLTRGTTYRVWAKHATNTGSGPGVFVSIAPNPAALTVL